MSALLDALEYLGDSLDKPGRAVRGVLGGRPEELLAAVPFSDSLGWTDPADAVSGRDLLSQQGWSTGSEFGDMLLGAGVDMALDPTTYIGIGGVGRLAGAGAKATGAVRVAGLLPLRRQVTKLDDVETYVGEPLLTTTQRQFKPSGGALDDIVWMPQELPVGHVQSGFIPGVKPGTNFTARAVGGIPYGTRSAPQRLAEVRGTLRDYGAMGLPGEGVQGVYDPAGRTLINFADDPDVMRHELIHALADRARASGDLSALPLPLRVTSTMRESGIGPVRAAGYLGEESIAKHVGGQDTMLGFLFGGQPEYARNVRTLSPLVADLFESGPAWGPAAATVGGSSALLAALMAASNQ